MSGFHVVVGVITPTRISILQINCDKNTLQIELISPNRHAIIDMSEGDEVIISELFNREDVTDAEWEQAAADIKAQEAKQWAEFIERSKYYDDAFYSDPYDSRFANFVANKGYGYQYSLADMDGNVVDAKIVDGKFGQVWLVNKADGSIEWVNVSTASTVAKEQAHYNKKGYQLVMCEVRVRVAKGGNYYFDWNDIKEMEIAKDE